MTRLRVPPLSARLQRHRRLLAALCAAGCVLALGLALRPAPPPATTVLVVVRAVAGGAKISAGDVEVRAVPDAGIPEGALSDAGAVVGRVAVAPLARGTVLTGGLVVSPRFGHAAEGLVLAPVRLADADVGALLAAGDVIDIVAASEAGATVVARGARIVALPVRPAASGPLSGGDASGVLIIVEVPPGVAAELARAAAGARLSIALR